MIIELSGPPGAGKSTIVKMLFEGLAKSSQKAMSPIQAEQALFGESKLRTAFQEFLYLVGLFVRSSPSLIALFSRHMFRKIPWNHKYWLLRWLLRTIAQSAMLRAKLGNEVIVFDEGPFHQAATFFTSGNETAGDREIAKILQLVQASDLLLIVSVPEERCLQRLEGRKLPYRLQGKSRHEKKQFLHNQAEAIRHGLNVAEGLGWNCVVVNNAQSLDTTRTEVEHILESLDLE
ncbi:MAG: AAA family ATPase [Chloroflexi bacterium]|nr:AAA family ATPase [Chloroflexota bacterium]